MSMRVEEDWWDTSREVDGGQFELAGGDCPRGATGVEALRWAKMNASRSHPG